MCLKFSRGRDGPLPTKFFIAPSSSLEWVEYNVCSKEIEYMEVCFYAQKFGHFQAFFKTYLDMSNVGVDKIEFWEV